MTDPLEIVLAFVTKINEHDVDGIAALMTDDHLFVDSLGNQVQGREKMRSGWQSYFGMCPDYRISHGEIFLSGTTVAIFGSAGGTIAAEGELREQNHWQIPGAWMAQIKDERISEWRVYADNKPVYEILSRIKR